MRSTIIDINFWTTYCKRIFGSTFTTPSVDFVNKKYGGINITGSNIIFVNAVEDPWSQASLL